MSVPTVKAVANSPVVNPDTVILVLNFTGAAYVTGGVALPIAAGSVLDPSAVIPVGPNNELPIQVKTVDEGLDGYYTEWIPGTTLANGKLRCWQPGGAEYAAGAFGAPFTNANAKVTLEITLDPSDR